MEAERTWWTRKKREIDPFSERDRHQRFYQSKAWQRARLIQLSNQPLCEHCLASGYTTAATEVDHVIPISEDWSKRLSDSNFSSLDKICHARKSARDLAARKERERDAYMEDLNNFE